MSKKVWLLGPCSMESEELFREVYDKLSPIMKGKEWYLKASFDKANRTSIDGARGPGLEYSLEVWKNLKKDNPEVKLVTDVHETYQIEMLAEVIDCIQIPAFLCRQTDLIVESAKHFDIINIKKGQWLGPDNLINSVDKIKHTNPKCQAWICDRGSNFGYYDLFVNYGIVDTLKQHYDKVILDATHSIQRSRKVYQTQGDRKLAERYFVTAPAFNYDGVFAECHPNPPCAVSDGDCQINLSDMERLIRIQDNIQEVTKGLKSH